MNTRMMPLLVALWMAAPIAAETPPPPTRTTVTNSGGDITVTKETEDRGLKEAESKAQQGAASGDKGNKNGNETKADKNTTAGKSDKKREQEKKTVANKKQDDKRGQAAGAGRNDAGKAKADPSVDKQSAAKDRLEDDIAGAAESGTGAEHWLDEDPPSEEGKAPAVENSALGMPRWGLVVQLLSGVNLLLAALLIVGVLMTKRRVEQTLKRLDLKTAEMDRQARSAQERMTPLVAALQGDQEKIRRDLEVIRSGMPPRTASAPERRNDWAPQNPFGANDDNPAAEEADSYNRGPTSVSDYLARAQQSELGVVRLRTDSVNDHVFITAPDGFYFLLRGNDGSDYAIPYHERFTTKQLYDTYFTSAYDCRAPGAGAVWVVRPASVRRQGDLWRLDERGEIEVRSA